MRDDIERHDVVVVGAGPVGLTLSLALARDGIDVLVLEKEPGTAEHSRAPAIWPGTQEILASLGVLEAFVAGGIAVSSLEMWDVDRQRVAVTLPLHELEGKTQYPQLLIVPQSTTERLLHQAIRDTTAAEVRFSSEVTVVEAHGDGVEVRYRRNGRDAVVRARFVAGCDGAHSTIRGSLGASFDGITYDARVRLADVLIPQDGTLRFPRLSTDGGISIAIRMDGHLWRLILPFTSEEDQSSDQRIRQATSALFPSSRYETVWTSDFRLHRRMSSRWTDGRMVLAGDAAHLNSPVGGEGMNAGMRDAIGLARALRTAIQRDSGDILQRWASERRREIENGVNRFTDRLTRLLLAGRGRLIRPGLWTASAMLQIPPIRRRILHRIGMIQPED